MKPAKNKNAHIAHYLKLKDWITALTQQQLPLEDVISGHRALKGKEDLDLINEPLDKYRNLAYRPPKPQCVAESASWNKNIENLYRYRTAGYCDEVYYWIIHKSAAKQWELNGFIKELPSLQKGRRIRIGPFRECTDNKLSQLRLNYYDERYMRKDQNIIEILQQGLAGAQNDLIKKSANAVSADHDKLAKKKDPKVKINGKKQNAPSAADVVPR
ncbi:uncharacterized protein LOC129584869 isoform X2 [Paramacrobiotus metropolitanus]|nr:uncharacterized protein LOC129584869 isoform X2 [Paramacrobiotus metropolitanus]